MSELLVFVLEAAHAPPSLRVILIALQSTFAYIRPLPPSALMGVIAGSLTLLQANAYLEGQNL